MRKIMGQLILGAALACALPAAIAGAEEVDLDKCEWYEFYSSDGSECFIVNVKNTTTSSSKTNQNVKASTAGGATTKAMKKNQGRTYTSKYTSIEVHETGANNGKLSWTVAPANPN